LSAPGGEIFGRSLMALMCHLRSDLSSTTLADFLD
jgi:hypothetical protein